MWALRGTSDLLSEKLALMNEEMRLWHLGLENGFLCSCKNQQLINVSITPISQDKNPCCESCFLNYFFDFQIQTKRIPEPRECKNTAKKYYSRAGSCQPAAGGDAEGG